MISKEMQDALNGQINAEGYSSYLYLAMSAYLHSINLRGFAHWMRVQTQEELGHSIKIYDYVNGRGGRPVLKQIEAPPSDWKSPLEVFEAAYGHECMITGLINTLVDKAISEGDHATNVFLQWFVTEQVEEEATADDVVQKLRMVGDSPGELLILDRELAGRQVGAAADPAPAQG